MYIQSYFQLMGLKTPTISQISTSIRPMISKTSMFYIFLPVIFVPHSSRYARSYDQQFLRYRYYRLPSLLSHFQPKMAIFGSKLKCRCSNIEICNSNVRIPVKMKGKTRSYDQRFLRYRYYRLRSLLSHFQPKMAIFG